MILPPNYEFLREQAKNAPKLTGKFKIVLDNCGKKMLSEVGTQGNREKNRRLRQEHNLRLKQELEAKKKLIIVEIDGESTCDPENPCRMGQSDNMDLIPCKNHESEYYGIKNV